MGNSFYRVPRNPAGRAAHRFDPRIATACALLAILTLSSGCGALFRARAGSIGEITFATGELQVTEEVPLRELSDACEIAVETLGYQQVAADLDADKIHWQAATAGGDPVDIRLKADGPKKTAVRIRVGAYGDEARSRLVLEQIRQSL